MRIAIFGAGYVGLVSGVCLSDFGHQVACVDKDKKKIADLKKGKVSIFEPGLRSLIKKNVSSKRLFFSNDIKSSIEDYDVIFLAIDTPCRRGDGQANLKNLFSAITNLVEYVNSNKVVVIKSTVPVGTNKEISDYIKSKNLNFHLDVVSNPEFLREGSAIEDFIKPDRIVVGTNSNQAIKIMTEIYKPLYSRESPIVFTDPESAELIKYSSNAFLATKISFMNEIAHLCEKTGADVKEVAKGMGIDGRIGDKFLNAGPGYGGSCFPKDTLALVATGKENGAPQTIVETVIRVNENNKNRMVSKIMNLVGNKPYKKIVCVFGVTFKPNTDDMREAPSLTIIPKLQSHNCEIRVVDPKGKTEGETLLKNVSWYQSPYIAAKNSDLIVILTEWNEFKALDLGRIANVMRNAKMADLRNIYSQKEVIESGFQEYICVGRENGFAKNALL